MEVEKRNSQIAMQLTKKKNQLSRLQDYIKTSIIQISFKEKGKMGKLTEH